LMPPDFNVSHLWHQFALPGRVLGWTSVAFNETRVQIARHASVWAGRAL
jgi:hypothetical protein